MDNCWKRTWAEINTDNLIHNFGVVKQHLKQDTKVCCVLKADAYGHHAPHIARALLRGGADWFAVSNIEEALQLRSTDISIPILILGYTPPECAEILINNSISQCVHSYEYAKALSREVAKLHGTVKVHIKIDTGMGRIGFKYSDNRAFIDEIENACFLKGIKAEGIFTHFAISDVLENGRAFTLSQFDKFNKTVNILKNKGINFKYKHCSNSAAIFNYPEFQMNMVRVGIVLYGLSPFGNESRDLNLKPVMTMKTVVSHVKTIHKGDTVSYGCKYTADDDKRIATVPLGYADGFLRSNGNASRFLLINGRKAPIVGTVCMDQLMLDVSDIENVCVGDEVTVFGDSAFICTADDIARANNTINYEIVCSVGKRVPKVFIENGEYKDVYYGLLDATVK